MIETTYITSGRTTVATARKFSNDSLSRNPSYLTISGCYCVYTGYKTNKEMIVMVVVVVVVVVMMMVVTREWTELKTSKSQRAHTIAQRKKYTQERQMEKKACTHAMSTKPFLVTKSTALLHFFSSISRCSVESPEGSADAFTGHSTPFPLMAGARQ